MIRIMKHTHIPHSIPAMALAASFAIASPQLHAAGLTASDGAANDQFGWSVSQSGSIGLVGANSDDIGANGNQGSAYVFRSLDTATGTVTQNVKLTASDGAASDNFGRSVGLDGDQFIIGANFKNSNTGKAYTGSVASVTTLNAGNTSKVISGISFVSQDDWIIGETTNANQVTLSAEDAANVAATGKGVYIGKNAGSNNNTLIVAGNLTANQINVGATGTTGNVLQIGLGGITGTLSASSVITNHGNVIFNRSDTITQGTHFGTAAMTGTGSVTQSGSGTTVFNAANTYTGITTISGGKLVVNGSITDSAHTTVKSGATLGGSGTVGALTIEAGGNIAPGNSPGILKTGNYNQAGTLNLELGGTAVGSTYDQVNVTGSVTLSGNFAFTFGYIPADGDMFFIINNDLEDAISGVFAGRAQGNEFTQNGYIWRVSYVGDFASNSESGGNDVSLNAVSAIPEPGTYALLAIAGMWFCIFRRGKTV